MQAIILAQAMSSQTPSLEIYRRAVAAMHAIKAPAYLQWDMSVTTTIRDAHAAVVVQHVKLMERTSAHEVVARIVDETVHDRADPFEIAADLFLGHADESARVIPGTLTSGLDNVSGAPLQVIGSVVQVHYTVRTAGIQDVPTCSSAVHLKLEPVRLPLVYNLRDVWVDQATSRICQAMAVWDGQVNRKHVIAPITLTVDRNGFIRRYTTTASARFLTGVVSVEQEGSYENLQPAEQSVWSTFTSEPRRNEATR